MHARRRAALPGTPASRKPNPPACPGPGHWSGCHGRHFPLRSGLARVLINGRPCALGPRWQLSWSKEAFVLVLRHVAEVPRPEVAESIDSARLTGPAVLLPKSGGGGFNLLRRSL